MSGLGAMMAGGNPAEGREEDDFYPTPPEVTQALVNAWQLVIRNHADVIWEPCAGDGAMVRVLEQIGCPIHASDINPRAPGIDAADFLVGEMQGRVGERCAIITNPPFGLAEEMIAKAARMDGVVFAAFMLKATFWHAKTRQALFRQFMPFIVHPLTWRPDFKMKGRPTMEMQWCIWLPQHKRVAPWPLYRPLDNPAPKARRGVRA
jgi:hypothetical protein